MAAKRPKGRRPAAARRPELMVSDEERRCLIEDVAYFRAERFRHVEPGRYRAQDRAAAEAGIETVLKRYKRARCS